MRYVFWISVCALIIFHFYLITSYSVNVPHWDDFDAILEFNNAFALASNGMEKLNMLFVHHNEHRIFLTRVVSFIDFWLFENINFVRLLWVGNLFFISVLTIIICSQLNELKLVYLLPIPFLILNIQSFENFIFPMASIQNIGVIFLVIYSLFLLSRADISRRRIVAAFIMAVIATFSSGNGFLALLCGLIILLLTKRKAKIVVGWAICTCVVLIINFSGQHFGLDMFHVLHQKADVIVPFYFILIGNSFATIFNGYTLCVFTGFGILIVFFWILQKRLMKLSPFIFTVLIFLFLSIGIISLFRVHLGISYAISERYRIYSFLICVFIYLGFIRLTKDKGAQLPYLTYAIALLVTVFAIYNYVYSYVQTTPSLSIWKNRLITSSTDYYEKINSSSLVYPIQERAAQIISTSDSLGIYQLPYLGDNKIEFSYSLERVYFENDILNIEGWAIYEGMNSNHVQVEVILDSNENRQQIFKALKVHRQDISSLHGEMYSNSGFEIEVDGDKIEKGMHKIFINMRVGTIENIIETEKDIFWK